MGRNPRGQNWWIESPEQVQASSQWLLQHGEAQSASLRRVSYDEPRCAAGTAGESALHLVGLLNVKLGSAIGQELDDAADVKLAPKAGRRVDVEG